MKSRLNADNLLALLLFVSTLAGVVTIIWQGMR